MRALKLEKNKIVEFTTGDMEKVIKFFYPPDKYPSLIKKIYNLGGIDSKYFLYSNTNYQTGEKEEVYYKNVEVIEKLGLYYDVKGKVHNKPTPTVNSKELPFVQYNIQSSDTEINRGTISTSYNATKGIKYSFGVELETSGGRLSYIEAISNELNIQCVRDGSIGGGEYVTGVLKGDAGFIHLSKILANLRKHTTIDKRCGVHVHVGGATFNKSFTVFAFLLGLRIEEEIFQTLPESRKDNKYCDYLSKLPVPPLEQLCNIIIKYGFEAGVDMVYDILYEKMSYGDKPDISHNKLTGHKYGRYCGQYNDIKMEYNFRYKWLNLIPANFNMKGANTIEEANSKTTLEFRNHSASLSFVKIKNWTLFCMAFVSYVENYKGKILDLNYKLSMNSILEEVFQNKSERLINYFNDRKETFGNTPKEAEDKEYNVEQESVKTKKETILCA